MAFCHWHDPTFMTNIHRSAYLQKINEIRIKVASGQSPVAERRYPAANMNVLVIYIYTSYSCISIT